MIILAIISLCCQELEHASFLLELLVLLHCFDGMYSSQSLMYKAQIYNTECHWLAHMRCGEMWWLEVIL